MSHSGKRKLALLLAAVMGATMIPAGAADVELGENLDAGESVSVTTVTSPDQVSDLVAENWQDDYFGEITVDPDTQETQKDGEDTTLSEELDISAGQAQSVMSSADTAEDYINEKTDYSAYTDGDDVVHITAPYQTCRIVLQDVNLGSDYGASAILYDPDDGEYTLQFDSEEQTEQAYRTLTEEVGTDHCYLDQVITLDMMTGDGTEEEAAAETASEGVSLKKAANWGSEYTGTYELKQEAEEYGLTGKSMTVAVIDSGITKTHSIFDGRKITGYNFRPHGKKGKTVNHSNYQDTDPYQDADPASEKGNMGHGTHVAGIIADATPDNVNIMALRVFDDNGQTTFTVLKKALQYAANHGASVVNLSLGAVVVPDWYVKILKKQGKNVKSDTSYRMIDSALDELNDKNIVVCCASGNERHSYGELLGFCMNYPANYSTTFAVAALDEDSGIAYYSSWGEEIDFAAPGSNIRSAKRGTTSKYVTMSGTSMATPELSAACAVIKLAHPEYSCAQVKQTLISYSEDLGNAGKDYDYGYGAPKLSSYLKDNAAGNNLGIPDVASLTCGYKRMNCTGEVRRNPVTVTLASGETLDSKYYTVRNCATTRVGTATVIVTGRNGYTGQLEQTFQILPPKLSKPRLSNTGSGKLKVRWDKAVTGGGYQIEYARNKNFTNAKKITVKGRAVTARTITGLGRYKYYVRVRVYKTVDHVKVYGRWSTYSAKTLTR